MQQRGWLTSWSSSNQTALYDFLNKYSVLLQGFILVVEVGAIFILRNIKLACVLLCSFVLMHLSICLVSGILFWKWMLIDALLITIIIVNRNALIRELFTRSNFKISIVIVLFSFIWLRPYTIIWFDTKLNQFFVYEAEDVNGFTCELNKNDFNPYHQWIQYDKLWFLVNHEVLNVSGFGYTSNYSTKSTLDTISAQRLNQMIVNSGANKKNQKKSEEFANFLKVFFKNKNLQLINNHWYNFIQAPNDLNGSKGCASKVFQEIKAIRVYYCLNLNINGKTLPVKKENILTVNI